MPDLHGWITQQITRREADIRSAEEDHGRHWATSWHAPTDSFQLLDDHGTIVASDLLPGAAGLLAVHDPAAVLRRCAADRRILARHRLNPDAYWADAARCDGCGTEGEMDYPRTENLNDCPELLDLGHAHGLTDEILATLDRPQPSERPAPGPGFGMPDVITESLARLYADMHAALDATVTRSIDGGGTGQPLGILGWEPREPTPMDRALDILDPELRACPLYDAGPPVLRGPNWKARP